MTQSDTIHESSNINLESRHTLESQRIQKRRRLIEKVTLPCIVFTVLLLGWQTLGYTGLFLKSLFPTPTDVLLAIFELIQSGELIEHAQASLFRVFVGFISAVFLAIPFGIVLGWHRRVEYAFTPLVQIMRTISPIAWIPLAVLWFGIGDGPAVFIILITSFFPICIATAHAHRHTDPNIIKAAINFGASGKRLLVRVILPASVPYIMVGLRIALGIAWIVVVAAEMVGMRSGLGFMILDARNFLRTDMVIAGMVIIGLIGFVLDKFMGILERRVEKHKVRVENIWTWSEE